MTQMDTQDSITAQEPPYLYITTTGWKSGQPHEIEIWFVEYEGRYYLCSGGRYKAHWVQNVQRHPAMIFKIGDRNASTRAGRGRVVPELETELVDAVKSRFAAKYEWSDGLLVEITPMQ